MAFLIIGTQNTGTTLLARLLDRHPDTQCIHTPGNKNMEFSDQDNFLRKSLVKCDYNLRTLWPVSYPEFSATSIQERIDKLLGKDVSLDRFEHFAAAVDKRLMGGGNRFCKDNLLLVSKPVLDLVYPKVPKLICLRDPQSIAVSKNPDNPLDKARATERIIEYVLTICDDPDVLVMRYENLTGHTNKVLAQVCDFIGVSPMTVPAGFENINNRNFKFQRKDPELKGKISTVVAGIKEKLDSKFPVW